MIPQPNRQDGQVFIVLHVDSKLTLQLTKQMTCIHHFTSRFQTHATAQQNRRTCIHHFTAAATGQDVFDVVAAAGQKRVKSTLWSFQQHR